MGAKKKKPLAGLCIIVAALFMLLLFFIMPFARTKSFIESEYAYNLDYYKELTDIPVLSQETKYTCYIVSMAIVKTYLGFETTEYALRSELNLLDRYEGMIPSEYLTYANKAFEPQGISVFLVNPQSQSEILNSISGSLENDMPVVIFYSAKDDWNKPHYNTHYAMVYGIDMENKMVKLSNPYGYLEELSFAELYDGLDFTSYEAEPFLFRLGRKAGKIHTNNIFVFESAHS